VVLVGAYRRVLGSYLTAFPRTPVAFEVHAIFDSPEPWQTLWAENRDSGRLGIAAWWCAERLSVLGAETVPVWPILLEAAAKTFTVCQTVGNLSKQPYRFSEPSLGLDYGTEAAWDGDDSQRAFTDHMDWIEGLAVHAGQSAPIPRFGVYEAWHEDATNAAFQTRLAAF
jgi:hypothetical protein